MNIDQAFTELLKYEGGYSNDPHDTGGETMWGITKRVAQANGYTGAMIDMRQDQAKAIYAKIYWLPIQADSMPPELRYSLFDAAVNSGTAQATKWLQRALGVSEDGVIGPQTLNAAASVSGTALNARLNGTRLDFMTDLKTWPTFGRGWAKRVAALLKN